MGGLRRRATADLAGVLVVSAVIALSMTYAVYLLTLHRAAAEHVEKVGQHYEQRIRTAATNWEETAFRIKARIEFFRLLDAPDRWLRLQALLTAESSSSVFTGTAVTDATGRVAFRQGDDFELPPMPAGGHRFGLTYHGSQDGSLYAVVCQPVWLGAQGMGTLHLATPLDNGFLWQQSYPDVHLLLQWQGQTAARSLDERGIAVRKLAHAEGQVLTYQVSLPGASDQVPVLTALVFTPPPFSLVESAMLGTAIFVVQALLLWSMVSGWFRRLLPRIEWLGRVARLYAAEGGGSAGLAKALREHADASADELSAVADSMRDMIASLTLRERERLAAETRLRESEQRFRDVAESAGEFIWEGDADLRFVYLSDKAADVFGTPLERLIGTSILDHVAPAEREPLQQRISERASRGEPFGRFEIRIGRPDGEFRWIAFTGTAVRGEDGRRTGAYRGVAEDITQQKRDVENLLLAEKVYANSDQAILITDDKAAIISVNPAFTKITGYSAAEALGRNPRIFASGRHDASFYAAMWHDLQLTGAWSGEVWDRRKNGEVFPKWMSINAVRDAAGAPSHYVAIFSDITERKENEARIEHLAYHDPLTGLPNRYALQARLVQSLADARRNGERVALMFIDLDRFKTINDSLGHDVGDQLLVAVSRRIRATLRETDTVARVGGDEFVIVLSGVGGPEDAARVAEKIIEHIGAPLALAGHTLHTSPSIGIGLFPTDGEDTETLMRNADAAMYYAKQHGRNTYHFFTADMNAAATERLLMETQLRNAAERGEMRLVYQPQVDLVSGRIVGVEALLRWDHPERGAVSPATFIPVAEETGLIVPLGLWVLETACRQAAAWMRAGFELRVAVNLSGRQFRDHDLAGQVAATLARTGLPAKCLELEITESAVMDNAERAIEIVAGLHGQGIHLAIDDFGTGYSSLAYLKRFEVDRLKIDRSFVMDLETDPNDVAIARSVVALARALGLSVTAEGIETPAQLAMLKTFGCAEGQGYLFSRPLSADDLVGFLQSSPWAPAPALSALPR